MSQPIRLDRVKPERIEWLWRERIPKGMISVIAGRADQGKGLLAAHIAAEASRAGIRVLYSAAEDSHGQMTRPRLEAAGVNMHNVLLWRFKLPKQWPELANIIVKHDIGLVVMDPLASHLSNGISRHSDNIRTVTDPLSELIEKTKTSVLIVEHTKKTSQRETEPLHMIGGTGSGLTAAARAAFLLGVDPRDEDRRVLACVKLNVREKPNALAFEMDTFEHDRVGVVPKLVFDEELTAFDAMSMYRREKGSIGRPPDKKAAAAEWLANYLALAGKPVLSSVVFEDAKQYNMSGKTLRRAAADMKVVKDPPGGGPKVTWELPDHVKKLMGMEDEPLPAPHPDANPDGDVDGEAPPSADDWDKALEEMMKGTDEEEGGDE
jgi:hypothetical protein